MELKKNPKKDLNRNSGIYFAAGLFLLLILTYVALEWKSFYNHEYDISQQMEEDLKGDAPLLTFIIPPPPPPPPVAQPIIEIIENEAEEQESITQSTQSNEDTKVIEVDDVEFDQVDEEVNVIWTTIEEVPIFPGCEKENDKRACFQKMINRHISKAFRYPEIAQEMGVEGKVFTQFTIKKDGSIGDVLLRGPDRNLKKEAQRIIRK